MKIDPKIQKSIESSVLCWLATASKDGMPSVSPKEIFCLFDDHQLIIANIASPGSKKNIEENGFACVSFVDILVQKGYQIKGKASVITENHDDYENMEAELILLPGGHFPFESIFLIQIESIKPILSPRYILFPETTEEDQIQSAKKTYGF